MAVVVVILGQHDLVGVTVVKGLGYWGKTGPSIILGSKARIQTKINTIKMDFLTENLLDYLKEMDHLF